MELKTEREMQEDITYLLDEAEEILRKAESKDINNATSREYGEVAGVARRNAGWRLRRVQKIVGANARRLADLKRRLARLEQDAELKRQRSAI